MGKRLTALTAEKTAKPGLYHDGGGYLQVNGTSSSAGSTALGKAVLREMGLGSASARSSSLGDPISLEDDEADT